MSKKKKVKNNTSPLRNVNNDKEPRKNVKSNFNPEGARVHSGFAFDVSFEGLYYSVCRGDFNNFLKGEAHFIEKFKEMRMFIKQITGKHFTNDLISNPGMRHCHLIRNGEYDLAKQCIEDSLNASNCINSQELVIQLLEGERLYQIGFEGGIRYIGTYDNERNIFRPYLIDYHHRLYPDKKHNKFNDRNLKYSIMNNE